MRRGRREPASHRIGREVLALLALLKRSFACSVSWLSGRMATSMIDLAARNWQRSVRCWPHHLSPRMSNPRAAETTSHDEAAKSWSPYRRRV
jgi:hypothetical protein